MKTKLYFLLLFLPLLLGSCHTQTDDFISKYCPGACTVIKGKLTTDGRNKPLAGVQLDVTWEDREMFSSQIRRKAVTTTDANGNFELRFLLRDDELKGENNLRDGIIRVRAQLPPEPYLTCYYNEMVLLETYDLTRDTTLTFNYNLPQKATVQVTAQNTAAMQQGEYMTTQFMYDHGAAGQEQECQRSLYWNSITTEGSAFVAANQPVVIRTTKLKNGTESVTEQIIALKPGQVYTYQVTF